MVPKGLAAICLTYRNAVVAPEKLSYIVLVLLVDWDRCGDKG